jgi:chemotaxis protein methyltransferase CheR
MIMELIREIAQLIEATSGFVVSEQGFPILERFVMQRVERGGFADIERYVDYLRRHPDSEEWRHILSKITIKESYLFRAHAQFDALANIVLPEIAQLRTDRRLRVLCAGCARGEEAATLAIVLADHPVVGDWMWSVLATDVDEAALADARKGIFGMRAVARVPSETLDRHFACRGDLYELDRELLKRIEFRRLNLVDQLLDLDGGDFDVIFLRNVLIYFRPELQRRVVETVELALSENGVLFLGPSESLLHLGTRLKARDLGDCFCYEGPSAKETETPTTVVAETSRARLSSSMGETVKRTETARQSEPVPTFDIRLEFMVEALANGDSGRAVAGLRALRHERPESAVTHALEGVALERTDDLAGAAQAYRAALYLAPEMDEVRFLLAQVLDGLGRFAASAREYRTALSGLGPAEGYIVGVLARLGFPDHRQMTEICRENLSTK